MRGFERLGHAARRASRRSFLVTVATAGCLAVVMPSGPLHAQAPRAHVVDLGIQHVQVECDDSGNWLWIYATGAQPASPRDRDGVDKAKALATLLAKTRIRKFFEQDVSDPNVKMAIEQAVSRGGASGDPLSPAARQRLAESILTTMRAHANRRLAAEDLSESGVDPTATLVWVRVGPASPLRRGTSVEAVVSRLREAPPPPPPLPNTPFRIGGTIKAPMKLKDVRPVYPQIAQSARIAGIVTIEATISPQGKVTSARVLHGVPLLNDAALDAVKQWEYAPTRLNGVPVPVLMTVTVNFTLLEKSPQPGV